jgi:hypothetical protein
MIRRRLIWGLDRGARDIAGFQNLARGVQGQPLELSRAAAVAHRVDRHQHLVARLHRITVPAHLGQIGRAGGQFQGPQTRAVAAHGASLNQSTAWGAVHCRLWTVASNCIGFDGSNMAKL